MSYEDTKTIICYMRVNSKEQLSAPETEGTKKTKRVWRARATGKTFPAPPWDREKEHLKNVAKRKCLGTYKVNSPEQRIAVKEWWAEYDRANRVTREEVVEMIRKAMTTEIKWDGRVRFTKEGIKVV